MTSALPPQDFTLLLPPGWVRIPLNDRENELLVRIVNAKVEPLPAQQREAVRQALTRELAAALASARSNGGIDVILSLGEVEGVAIPASCLVSYLDRGDRAVPLDGLITQLAADGDDVSVVEMAEAPAVRRKVVRTLPTPDDTPPLTSTEVDFFVPVPARTGLLVLSFATALEPLADALVVLFDAMAASFRWVR